MRDASSASASHARESTGTCGQGWPGGWSSVSAGTTGLASGVPVVATNVAGVGELVEDGVNGYVVPPGDPLALAERIGELLGSAERRERFGAAGRMKIETEFDVHREAAWLYRIMTAALRDRVEAVRPNGT